MTVACRVCGESFRQITNTHLETHGLMVTEYVERWPEAPLCSEETLEKYRDRESPNKGVPQEEWMSPEGIEASKETRIQPGEHLSPETEIKPGERLSPETEFESGHEPWLKGRYKYNFDMDADVAYCLGAILSDGSAIYDDREYYVTLHVRDKAFAQAFYRRLEAVGLSPWMGEYDKRVEVKCHSKKLYEYAREAETDYSILEPSEQRNAFVRGYYDGDGTLYVGEHDGYASGLQTRVSISTTDEKRSEYLMSLLEDMGYNPRSYSYDTELGGRPITSIRITIQRIKEIARFMREVGSSLERKRIDPGRVEVTE
jgi:hypothetical protein